MRHIHARRELEQLATQMLQRRAGGKGELARISLGQRREFPERRRRHRRMRGHHHRLLGVTGKSREIARYVITHFAKYMRVHCQRAGETKQYRIAIGRGFRRHRSSDAALRAATIVHHDLLLPQLCQTRRHDARHRIGAAARRRGYDPAYRALRKSAASDILRKRWQGSR